MPEKDPSQKKDFFISYNHNDQQWAEWIAWQLEEAGYNTVIQAWDFAAGRNFVTEMQKALAETERTIAVMSPAYLESGFAGAEWKEAFARDAAGTEGTLVQVKVAPCEPPGVLAQIIWIDLIDQTEAEAGQRLLTKVKRGRHKPAKKPAFPGEIRNDTPPPTFPGTAAPQQIRLSPPADPEYLFVGVPAMPREFVGRTELLQAVVAELVAGSTQALSAEGMAGVGKTTLAVAVAHHLEIQRHFDGILWAGLGTQPDVMSTLGAWAGALSISVTALSEPEDRARAIVQAIGARRMLLVIDDAWSVDAARALRCGGPRSAYLVTSRDDAVARAFAGPKATRRVEHLTDDAAFELLTLLAPEVCEHHADAARALVRSVGGLPLAVELLGAFLDAPEHRILGLTRQHALDQLTNSAERLRLAAERLGAESGGAVSLRETIHLSLNGLPPEAVRAFSALGAFAPKPETFDVNAAIAVTESDPGLVALLAKRHLLEVSSDGETLALHQIVADLAQEASTLEHFERHARYYLERVDPSAANWQAVEPIYGQLKWAYNRLTEPEEILRFVSRVGYYQRIRGLRSDAREWNEAALSAARQVRNQEAVATQLNNLGWLHMSMEEYGNALERFRQALPIERAGNDQVGEAVTLCNIGSVYDSLREYGRAVKYFKRALRIQREAGDREGEVITLSNLGSVYNERREYAKALKHYQQALTIARVVGQRSGEALALGNIGSVYYRLGNRGKALEYYGQALPIRCDLGDRLGEAVIRSNLASIYQAEGRFGEAAIELRQVVTLREAVQHPDLGHERAVLAEVESKVAGGSSGIES